MNAKTATIGIVRISYEHLLKPYAFQPGQEAKYSATFWLPKANAAAKQILDNAKEAAIQEGKNRCWNGAIPNVLADPVYDGDGLRPNGEPFGSECKNCWVFTASSKQAPIVVDSSLNPIINATEIYSGCYGYVNVTFSAYSSNGKRGVGCYINAFQKTSDGDPLNGRITAEEAFGAITQQFASKPTSSRASVYIPAPAYAQSAPNPYSQYIQTPQANAAYPKVDPITGVTYE